MIRILAIVLLLFSTSNVVICQTKSLTEKEKIETLIKSVENLENAKFYRNGSVYDAAAAASHLRMKVSKAGDRVKTAEDFIEKIASKSSVSGEDYKIIFSDGKEIFTKIYFYNILKTIE